MVKSLRVTWENVKRNFLICLKWLMMGKILAPTLAPMLRTGAAPTPHVPPPPLEDDENANNRRSVADMARLFSR